MPGDYSGWATEVRRTINDGCAQQFVACDRLYEFVRDMRSPWRGRSFAREADSIIFGLLCRSANTFWCALRHLRTGYGQQAAMLNRSLFEDMVDAHWVSVEPDKAELLYHEHDKHSKMVLAERMGGFEQLFGPMCLPDGDPEERKRLDNLFGRYGDRPWSTVGIHGRIKKIEHLWPTDRDRDVVRFMYLIAQRWNNQTLHVSPQSLNLVMTDPQSGEPTFGVGPSYELVTTALLGSFFALAQTTGLIFDHFAYPITNEARAELLNGDAFVGPDTLAGLEPTS
jgi:hypothetical protein